MNTTSYHPFYSEAAKNDYLAAYDAQEKQWPVPSETLMVDTSYGQTYVRINGPEDAQPLVLPSGAGSSSLMWQHNIAALSAQYRTYTFDSLINTGNVGRSIYTKAIKNADDANTWFDELFDKLGLNNINLVGPSYAGWQASQYAIHAPERLNKLILIAPAGTVLPFSGEYLQRSMEMYMSPDPNRFLNFFKWNFKDLAEKRPELIQPIADDLLLAMKCFVPPNPQDVPNLTAMSDAELQQITVPTLFIVGENETLYDAHEALSRLKAVAPQIQTVLIPDAGHDLLLVQAGLVNQSILDFLA